MNKKVRVTLVPVLAVVILGLAWVLYESIMTPVRFNDEYDARSVEVINKLKDIRTLQEQYKNTNGRFCSSIDSLVEFAETGKALLIKKTGTIPDGMTETEALKTGALRRDTTEVNPLEKLYAENKLITPREKIKELKYIPFSEKEEFIMNSGSVNKSGIDVAVFEAKAAIETYTKGMDEQIVLNKKAEIEQNTVKNYAGFKVGSMDNAVTDGNWE
ncbi:MAG: hypothetical protein HUK18_01035 [Bacteroidales bacterium]|nr:hypothetical protein [Bacteroidales bacterium]